MIRENLYDVEAIVGERIGDSGEQLYLVKWEGYDDEESTWEPEDNIPGHFVSDWNESKVQSDEMDLDESDGEDESDTIHVGRRQIEVIDLTGEDVDMEDVSKLWPAHSAAATEDERIDQPTEIRKTKPVIAAREYCNDPADGLFGFIQHTAELHTCNNPGHVGGETRTCSACLNAAVRNLNALQRDTYNNGAFFKICVPCAEFHFDLFPQGLRFCTCREPQNCCRCLQLSAAVLAHAKLTATQRGDNEGMCYHCRSGLIGLEWMSQCALCGGMKVEFDLE